MEQINDRIRALRQKAKLSVRKLAAELGVPPSTYAAYEDKMKFKKPHLPLDFAKKLSDVLAKNGVPVTEVMELAGLTGDLHYINHALEEIGDEEWLTVRGSVVAGVWKESTNWPPSEQYDIRFGASIYPKSQRFAVRMDGLSMNKTIQPGSDLECLYVKYSPYPPMPGDLVIVERKAHDLVELTCKRLAMDGDDYVLLCESYEPEFQEPIRIGRPDGDSHSDEEICVVGIVLSAKLDLAPKGLSQRRYPRR